MDGEHDESGDERSSMMRGTDNGSPGMAIGADDDKNQNTYDTD